MLSKRSQTKKYYILYFACIGNFQKHKSIYSTGKQLDQWFPGTGEWEASSERMDYKAHEKTLEEMDMSIVLTVTILQVSKLKLYFKYIQFLV